MNIMIKTTFLLYSLFISSLYASFGSLPKDYVHIFDVNGTVILSDSATGMTANEAMYEAIAQKIILTNGKTAKEQIQAETKEGLKPNKSYPKLLGHLDIWRDQQLIEEKNIETIKTQTKEWIAVATAAIEDTKQYNGVFPSFINYVEKALNANPDAIFLLHSFGYETQKVIDVLRNRFKDLVINEKFMKFNLNGYLTYGDSVYKDPSTFRSLLTPGLNQWQGSYEGWRAGNTGKIVWAKNSILFDDYADICAFRIQNGSCEKIIDKKIQGTGAYKVDTYSALTDPDYYSTLLEKSLGAVR